MKKVTIIMIFIFLSIYSSNLYSQNLSLSDIVTFMNYDLEKFENTIRAKGWRFQSANKPSNSQLGKVTFDYMRGDYNNKARGFITYYYSAFSNTRRISYQIHEESVYNNCISQLKSWGTKLLNTVVEEGNLVKIYRGKSYTFKVVSGVSSDSYISNKNVYIVTVFTNEDYNINFD